MPRNVDVPIKFKIKFTQPPVVVIAASKLDWEYGLPAGFDMTVVETRVDGFVYRISAVTPKMLNGVEVQYAAF